MNCPKCGSELNGNQKFCTNCGYKVHKGPTLPEKVLKIAFTVFLIYVSFRMITS